MNFAVSFFIDAVQFLSDFCCLRRYSLEIARGFGLTEGIIFRIGTMNANATHQKVDLVLRGLYDALRTTSNYIAPASKVYY